MSSFPIDFTKQAKLLEAYIFDNPADRQLVNGLLNKGYEILVGLSTSYAQDIIKMALEPAIKEYCPNDSAQRFTDMSAVSNWLSKGRAAFLLVKSDTKQLVGYGWAGDSISRYIDSGQTTFAIRIGEAGQGLGLATAFARLILASSSRLYNAKNFWLETWASNGAAVHVYEKLGFKEIDGQPDNRLTGDGGMVPDTRLYMSLDSSLL